PRHFTGCARDDGAGCDRAPVRERQILATSPRLGIHGRFLHPEQSGRGSRRDATIRFDAAGGELSELEVTTAKRTDRIYKVARAPEWEAAKRSGVYSGSPDDRRDGFVHFSTAEQLAGTLAKHFAGVSNLILVAIDPKHLGDALK